MLVLVSLVRADMSLVAGSRVVVGDSCWRWWWWSEVVVVVVAEGRFLSFGVLSGRSCGTLSKRSVTYRFPGVLNVLRLILHLEGIEGRSCRGLAG